MVSVVGMALKDMDDDELKDASGFNNLSVMSPLTVRKSDASEGLIDRDTPTTAYPASRKLSAAPAPMP